MMSVDRKHDLPVTFYSAAKRRAYDPARSSENIMRNTISTLCGAVFVKTRPEFLRNSATRRRLELDAYCEHLGLACEYDGMQHAKWPNQCHATEEQFHAQQARDRLKDELCAKAGVRLIRIPHTVPKGSISAFLRFQLFPSTRAAPVCAAYTGTQGAIRDPTIYLIPWSSPKFGNDDYEFHYEDAGMIRTFRRDIGDYDNVSVKTAVFSERKRTRPATPESTHLSVDHAITTGTAGESRG